MSGQWFLEVQAVGRGLKTKSLRLETQTLHVDDLAMGGDHSFLHLSLTIVPELEPAA
jgi:hypothetical protein